MAFNMTEIGDASNYLHFLTIFLDMSEETNIYINQ